jgi:hypothetical protein
VRWRTDGRAGHAHALRMTDARAEQTLPQPFFHEDSGAVRFWVRTEAGAVVGACVPRQALQYCFNAAIVVADALDTYLRHQGEIDSAVLRRIAKGSIEPVMLREADLSAAGR